MKNVRFSTENWSYLGNGEKYGQGYYENHWPWMTLKVTDNQYGRLF